MVALVVCIICIMRKRTRYNKRKASRTRRDSVVVGQIGDKQFVAKPLKTQVTARDSWDRQTVERTHAKAAKMSARARRIRLALKPPTKPRTKSDRFGLTSLLRG